MHTDVGPTLCRTCTALCAAYELCWRVPASLGGQQSRIGDRQKKKGTKFRPVSRVFLGVAAERWPKVILGTCCDVDAFKAERSEKAP